MKVYKLILICFTIFMNGCIEPFETTNLTFENILVVEGRLTNENKKHTIQLSRTFQVDSSTPTPEQNAKVFIIENNNITHSFTEQEPGVYITDNSFSAKANTIYQLKIETQNGKTYSSTDQNLTETAQLEEVNFKVTKKQFEDEDEVQITVNTFSSNSEANNFLYEYEETYKIVSRYWSHLTFDTSVYPPLVIKKVNPDDTRFCYNTRFSNEILQTETSSLSENRIIDFKVRSIPPLDFILRDRYSILVKQYVQTLNAYSYFETLNKFSTSENVFAQSQVSFIQGNIFSETDSEEKVIGFFEVNSVATKRLFFDKEDVVQDQFSEFPITCEPKRFAKFDSEGNRPLENALRNDYIFYNFGDAGFIEVEDNNDLPFILVKRPCGDCTVFGTSVKPDFWID